jgi:2-polyprenyl-3-methyl-5-hydroxy-6-metoxy-1,4-benzoquinol methylase
MGLEVTRVKRPPSNQYFNTGNLTPIEENSVELYEKFYGDAQALEEYYKGERMKFYKAVVSQVVDEGVDLAGKDVLDIGCGVGFLLDQILQRFTPASLQGADFSEEAKRFSRERFPEMAFFRHDIYESIPGKFDVVFCTEVLEHLERPHVALGNLISALRPRGILVLTVPDGRRDTINEHLNFWSPESWKAFLERECPTASFVTRKLLNGPYNFALLRFP